MCLVCYLIDSVSFSVGKVGQKRGVSCFSVQLALCTICDNVHHLLVPDFVLAPCSWQKYFFLGTVNPTKCCCPFALKMAACQLLLEITTFLRETFPYMPRPRPEPLLVSGPHTLGRALPITHSRLWWEVGWGKNSCGYLQGERSHCGVVNRRWSGYMKWVD